MNVKIASVEFLSSKEMPDEALLRELLSFDQLCSKSVQFTRDRLGHVLLERPASTMHWSRIWEWPWAVAAVPLAGKIVLNAGGGHSVMSCCLAKRAKDVIVADIDDDSLRHVQTQRPFTDFLNLRTFRWDLTNLRYATEGLYDVVHCISVLEHVPDWKKGLAEMLRVLKPGGHLVLTCDCEILPAHGYNGPPERCPSWQFVGMGAELQIMWGVQPNPEHAMVGKVGEQYYTVLAAILEKQA